MSYPIIRLKEKKEANVAFRHPWVFSGALDGKPDAEHGDLITLADRKGDVLATATYSTKSSIAARVFALGDVVIDQAWFVKRFKEAEHPALAMFKSPSSACAWACMSNRPGSNVLPAPLIRSASAGTCTKLAGPDALNRSPVTTTV